ncbi:MAG: hypothetical protein KFF46_02095 [Desulfobacterales bacterium]|nr:hypothetical protein [Desulfobacterales bacterium]
MDPKDYCNSMAAELTAWKAKLFDVIARTDKMSTEQKGKVWEYFGEMKIIIQDIEDKIESLRTECPSDWSPQKKEIENAHVDVRSKYDETLDYIGKASPMSVPG